MNEETEQYKRRVFQQVKAMSLDKFWRWSNTAHTNAYNFAKNHYEEAMFIELTPKQVEAVQARVIMIREGWDGVEEVTIDETGAWEQMTKNHDDLHIAKTALESITKCRHHDDALNVAHYALRMLNS